MGTGGAEIVSNNSRKLRPKRILVVGLIAVFLIVIGLGGFIALKSYLSLKKVVSSKNEISAEGLKGELDLSNLKGEGEGRVNILLMGVAAVVAGRHRVAAIV